MTRRPLTPKLSAEYFAQAKMAGVTRMLLRETEYGVEIDAELVEKPAAPVDAADRALAAWKSGMTLP